MTINSKAKNGETKFTVETKRMKGFAFSYNLMIAFLILEVVVDCEDDLIAEVIRITM